LNPFRVLSDPDVCVLIMFAARPMVPVQLELHFDSPPSSVTSSAQVSPKASMDRIHLITPSGKSLKTIRGVLPHPGDLTPEATSDEDDGDYDYLPARKRSPLARRKFSIDPEEDGDADEEDEAEGVVRRDMVEAEGVEKAKQVVVVSSEFCSSVVLFCSIVLLFWSWPMGEHGDRLRGDYVVLVADGAEAGLCCRVVPAVAEHCHLAMA